MISNLKTKSNYMFNSSLVILILFVIISIVGLALWLNNPSIGLHKNSSYSIALTTFLWTWVTIAGFYLLFSLINGIIILEKDWGNKCLNNSSCKTLWGTLTLIPLGLIASLVFGAIAKKQFKNYKPAEKEVYNKHSHSCCDSCC